MACSVLIDKSEGKLKINSDSYDLNRISDVQVKVLTWKDKLINMLLFGLITSSILFYFIPTEAQGKGMTLFLPAVAFLAGMVMAMVTSAKYVFRLEFKHADETGVQWITAAKSRNAREYEIFKLKEVELKQILG
ncbi:MULTISPECIES: hypothetical protein [Aeromonas]|nr:MULTISPECIES: hypothetical protein [Aeromonas]ARW81111.1 hypothetical protein O23A_p0359 [Aeromonas salmonicida]MCE9933016.1 hypothetical protein [Aeromonas salmonicida]MDM5112559.1 hypothetical protein [Aeromonas salmonicida]MDM5149026.1 hypothetical protein [Aeromonas salmonicida]